MAPSAVSAEQAIFSKTRLRLIYGRGGIFFLGYTLFEVRSNLLMA